MMRHPGLIAKADEVTPILGDDVLVKLQNEYLEVCFISYYGFT